MKLWHSFRKEMTLASRSYYFYIEVGMAIILLLVLMFVIPEEFDTRSPEYLYFEDLPEAVEDYIFDIMLEDDIEYDDGIVDHVKLEMDDQVVDAILYKSDIHEKYVVEDKDFAIPYGDKHREFSGVIKMNENNELAYEYYLQGYESERLKNAILVLHNTDIKILESVMDNQDVRALSSEFDELTDKEHVVPVMLTFNGSLMGMFLIAAYIFLDKNEGVIKAYAVTASSVWEYLLSKVGVIILTGIISSMIVTIPVLGFKPNYFMMLILIITSGFLASSIGLLIASFYKDLMHAFGTIYFVMIVLMVPAFSYFMPAWNPIWARYLPTYPIIQSFKEVILDNGDIGYVLQSSMIFIVVGTVVFLMANKRFKATLRV